MTFSRANTTCSSLGQSIIWHNRSGLHLIGSSVFCILQCLMKADSKLSHFLEFLENRFEAGTPAIGEAIGFGAAVDYLTNIGMQRIHNYEVLSFSFVNLAGLNNGRFKFTSLCFMCRLIFQNICTKDCQQFQRFGFMGLPLKQEGGLLCVPST